MSKPTQRPHTSVTAILCATLLLVGSDITAAADYLDLRRAPPIVDGDAAAGREKAAVCLACHDAGGRATAPIFPNLHGQTVDYLYWALVDFARGQRPMSPMTALLAGRSDQDLRDLAAFYATTTGTGSQGAAPVAASSADVSVLARGESLYLHGDPARGIPPCQGCHGADASGHPLVRALGSAAPAFYRTYPALRSQPSAFIVTKLTEYRDGVLIDSTNDFVMTGVARGLDDESIAALAAWLAASPP